MPALGENFANYVLLSAVFLPLGDSSICDNKSVKTTTKSTANNVCNTAVKQIYFSSILIDMITEISAHCGYEMTGAYTRHSGSAVYCQSASASV